MASTFNEFAAGAKKYGAAGAITATVGTVNPSGYIQREVTKQNKTANASTVSKVGNDGKSDTRSGLAQKALARTSQAAKSPTTAQDQKPKQSGPIISADEWHKTAAASKGVTISPTGQLQLPYDYQHQTEVDSAVNQYNSELIGIDAESANLELDNTQARYNIDKQYELTQSQTTNRNAARGSGFSSANMRGMQRDAGENLNQINTLQTAYMQGKNVLDSSTAQASNRLEDIRSNATASLLQRLGLDAGTLGYVTTNARK